MKVELTGINTVRAKLASGRVAIYHYHRASGRRLKGEPGSLDFMASWQAAEASITRSNRNFGTLQQVIQDYIESSAFTGLRMSTQKDYRRQISKIESEYGTVPLEGLNDPEIRADFLKWRDKLAKKSLKQADYAIVMLGTILSWALDQGSYGLRANYAAKPRRVYRPDRSEKIWLAEHIEAFNSVAPLELRQALVLATETGQRKGDLLRLTWAAFDGSRLKLKQSKRDRLVSIKTTRPLLAMLGTLPRGATTILTDRRGLPWNPKHDFSNFNDRWRRAMHEAGLKDSGLHFNDLRGTFITSMFESGATVAEAAAISGHSLKSAQGILDAYLARTGQLGDGAIVKLESHRAASAAKRLQNAKGWNKPRPT
jgi:integrase|tara:strand:- start:20619 stop:21725 length:1107 start_codon:yes stop_codon:yes gene_type:complete